MEDTDKRVRWRSVHVCPRCGGLVDLEKLCLIESTTGLVTCTKCDWSGPIEIRIVNCELAD